MLIDHDVHVHTTLSSCCHDENLIPANTVARAAELVGCETEYCGGGKFGISPAAAGYEGFVSIGLEDASFSGSEAGEKQGLLLARRFLEGC